jgi:hypothetical protein
MFHCLFANATQVLLCKSNWHKLENMKMKPNNTHIPYTKVAKPKSNTSMNFFYFKHVEQLGSFQNFHRTIKMKNLHFLNNKFIDNS